MKKKQKTIGKLLQEAQKHFNAYIRQRDKDKPCISSGEYCDNKDCGHFFPVSTHSGLRFDEDNAHGESIRMNRFDDGHLIFYRENLLGRIGQERFDALYERAAEYKRSGYKWSRSELEELIEKYKSLCK
jgi:hypothetical protein